MITFVRNPLLHSREDPVKENNQPVSFGAEEYPSIALKGHVTDAFCQSNDDNRKSHDSSFRVIAHSIATVLVHAFIHEEPVNQVEKPCFLSSK